MISILQGLFKQHTCIFHLIPMRAICPANSIDLDLIIVKIIKILTVELSPLSLLFVLFKVHYVLVKQPTYCAFVK